jgi:transposase
MARPAKEVNLRPGDLEELQSWLRRPTMRQSHAERARIIVLSSEGKSALEIGLQLGVSTVTVFKWRARYRTKGLAGLTDLPRPGQPRKLAPATVKKILDLTTKRIPYEATHWSLRLMMKYAGVTQWQVQQVWAASDLRPHRLRAFKISNDPQFAEKVVDVVGLYLQPPDNAVVLSVDEKTQIQALDRTQPLLQLRPGQIERRTHDYKRHGTASLYAAFDIASGKVMSRVTKRHRSREFLAFLRQIEGAVESHLDLHLIMDNSSTHKTKEIRAFLDAHPRIKVHFTPTSASWLNAVEGWFGQLERRALYRGAFSSVEALRQELRRYIEVHNRESAKPFIWTKSAESILNAVEHARTAAQHSTAD